MPIWKDWERLQKPVKLERRDGDERVKYTGSIRVEKNTTTYLCGTDSNNGQHNNQEKSLEHGAVINVEGS